MFKENLINVMGRGVAVWILIMAVETIHGILRSILLAPLLGDFRARQVSVFIGSALVMLIAFIFVRWIKSCRMCDLVLVGVMWVALTVGFELALGRFLGLSWDRILSDYDIPRGGLMIIGLIVMLAAAPVSGRMLKRCEAFYLWRFRHKASWAFFATLQNLPFFRLKRSSSQMP